MMAIYFTSRLFSPAAVLLAATLLGAVPNASAQLRASERGYVAQNVDGTRVTVDYSRPRARGRSPIYRTPMVPPVEVLTLSFDSVRHAGMTLTMAWGTRAFDVANEVSPTYATAARGAR